VLVVASLSLVVTPWLTGPAAGATCLWNPGSATLEVTIDDVTSLAVSGTDILVDGDVCVVGATTEDVDLIDIEGSALDDDDLVLDLEEAFAPGAAAETGDPEIEIAVDLGAGEDVLIVNGGPASEDIALGADGANLNADDDADVTIQGTELVQLLGQEGDDSLSAAGNAVVGAGYSGDLLIGGGVGSDTITGGPTGDELAGGDDHDFLIGLGGVDNLVAGAGSDLLVGGPRADTLNGGPGGDTVDYSGAAAGVKVNLSGPVSGGAGSDQVAGIEHVIGSDFADTLVGNGLANELLGGAGNDTINGRGGGDFLDGEAGTRDVVSFAGAPSAITANLTTGTASGWGADTVFDFEDVTGSARADAITGTNGANTVRGGGGGDTVGGRGGVDRLIGGAGGDRLNGGDSHDRLEGGDGADLLHGNAGNDALNGGPGTDTCFQDAGSGTKTSCERP
jgi:Ca2+-binding RTX toxin-like protein